MSNLRFTDKEITDMETYPGIQATRIGRAEPYHLAYARAHRDNEILNPRLPGKRPVKSSGEGEVEE